MAVTGQVASSRQAVWAGCRWRMGSGGGGGGKEQLNEEWHDVAIPNPT